MQHVDAALHDTKKPTFKENLPVDSTLKGTVIQVSAVEVATRLALLEKEMHRFVKGKGRHLIAGQHEELSLVIASVRFVSMHASAFESK